jgi:putative transposase
VFTDPQFAAWCQQHQFAPDTLTLIAAIRSGQPTRLPRGGRRNVVGRYPSQKMHCTIQFESHTVELAGIREYEHQRSVREYYDQPGCIELRYASRQGRNLRVLHTPDFFVLRADGAGWEEWKSSADLADLAERMPQRYQQRADGSWSCPPGEAYAAERGLTYRVRSSAAIDWLYQRNLVFLEDYLLGHPPDLADDAVIALRRQVSDHPGVTVAELLHTWDADMLYALIATDALVVDLHAAPLVERQLVRVYATQEVATAYASVQQAAPSAAPPVSTVLLACGQTLWWDEVIWTIQNVGQTMLALRSSEGVWSEIPRSEVERLVQLGRIRGLPPTSDTSPPAPVIQLLSSASPRDLAIANARQAHLTQWWAGMAPATLGIPARTLRQWDQGYQQAAQTYGRGYLGLIPHIGQRGNRLRKLPEATIAAMNTYIAEHYETAQAPGKLQTYQKFMAQVQAQGAYVPSYKSFVQAIARRAGEEQTRKRFGKRVAYQERTPYLLLELTTPRHGDRPWEIVHLDHTELDLELLCSRTGRNLGRPWLSLAVDAYSRRILAFILSYDPPSYRTDMLLLRELVRRHQRLPQTIVVDGGKDFASTYFQTLLAYFACTLKQRPPAEPRNGAVCERLFGTTNTAFIHTLSGNTKILRHLRQVTPAVDPQRLACWTLEALQVAMATWCYEVYDTCEHGSLGLTPRDAFAQGIALSGARPDRLIPYDETFQMLTLPTTPRGTARIHPGYGIKLHYTAYWADAFRDPAVHLQTVPVRYDPDDMGVIYVYVHQHWMQAISAHYAVFRQRTEREIQLATQELRRRNALHAQHLTITAKQMAAFLVANDGEEVLLKQRLCDAAAKALRETEAPPTVVADLPVAEAPPRDPPLIQAAGDAYEEYL